MLNCPSENLFDGGKVIYKKLASLKGVSFRFKPINPEIRSLGLDIFREYVDLPDGDREGVRACIDGECSKKLLSMSGALAEEGMNTRSVDWIKASIGMHAIEGFRYDYRESYRHLVLAYYAIGETKTSFADLVSDMVSLFSPNGVRYIRDFCGRDRSFNRLSSVGIEIKVVGGKQTFAPIVGSYSR